jgi:hypothetical protein
VVTANCAPNSTSCTASCAQGERVLGGGYRFNPRLPAPSLSYNGPSGNGGIEWLLASAPASFIPPASAAYAICANVD